MVRIDIETTKKIEMIDITKEVRRVIKESQITKGVCHIYIPHTTAAVTINENTDPNVKLDILRELDRVIPPDKDYLHKEGNAAAHIKTSIIGSSETIFIENEKLVLGTWQSIFFCEFDGPRNRDVLIKVIKE